MSSVIAPELLSGMPSEVDVVLDEEDLFDTPTPSGVRLKIGGVATHIFEPSEELLDQTRDDEEITRPVDARELRERLAASDRRRR